MRTYIERARAAKPGIDVVVGEVLTRWDPWSSSLVLGSQASEYKNRIAELASSMNTSSERVVVANTLTGWDPVAHTWDGTHPNAAGETLIAQRVSEGLAKLGLGSATPNVYNANARWSVKAPAPTVTPGTEKATVSWSLNSTGSTSMYISYHLDKPGQDWLHLPYPVGSNYGNQWTIEPLAGGANYDFALIANKGFMSSDQFSPVVSRAIPGLTPGAPKNLTATVIADDPTWGHRVQVRWDAGTNAQAYFLSQRTFPGGAGVDYEELPYAITDTSWTFAWLESGRKYRFRSTSARGFLRSTPSTSGLKRSRGFPVQPTYAVLGDSYSAGNGRWEDSDGYYDTTCWRALESWSMHVLSLFSPSRQIHACSGAVINDMQGQIAKARTQFAGRPNSAQLLTISVGGNDVGFRDALTRCMLASCAVGTYQSEIIDRVDVTGGRLETLYGQLADEFPYADIVVLGYPSPVGAVERGTLFTCGEIYPDEEEFVGRATRRLNTRVTEAANATGTWGGVGGRIYNEFWTHGGCSQERWIHAIDLPVTSNSFHQNAGGHYAYGRIMNEFLSEKME